jgi:hypothetical protein
LLCFLKPYWFYQLGFFVFLPLTFIAMEGASDQLPQEPDLQVVAKQRIEAASDFLSFCDRVSTGYDSGYYWEDVQRALRIAAGLEQWPEKG